MGAFSLVKLVGQGLNNTIISGGLVPKGAYDNSTDYAVGDSVDYQGSSYVMHTNAAAGVLPTDTTKWQVLANKGATGATGATGSAGANGNDGAAGAGVVAGGTSGQILAKNSNTDYDTHWITAAGTGDMLAATYDPQAIAADAFDQDNMTDGTTNKNYTATEKTKLAAISGTNTGDQTLPVKASGAELDTGTDDAKFATAKALVDSHNVPSVVPSTAGKVMRSDGTDWKSAALTTADVAASTNKNYVTDAQQTVIGNTSGTNTGDQSLPTDATITVTDVTTNNASTTAHGFAPKATAPASGLINVVAIANGETAYTNKTILDSTVPSTQAFGDAAAAGTNLDASHSDHKHAMPATPTSVSGNAGTATALATPRAIYGNNFDGTAALAQVIASTYGGTGNGFTKFSGPTTAEKTFTLPDASSTIIVQGGALGTPSSGTLTNCTFPTLNQNTSGTASNVSGTPALPNGTTATTQSANDNSTKLATTAYADLKLPKAGGTMSGDITLGENTSIALDPAGSADGKYSGITVTATGGATIAFGDLVTLDKDDSRWELVDISVAAAATGDARGILGMAVTSSSDGAALTVLLHGIIRADANFPALTIGAPVYASTTGDVVVAQPTTTDHVIRIIGFAMTADELYFNPDNAYITHT